MTKRSSPLEDFDSALAIRNLSCHYANHQSPTYAEQEIIKNLNLNIHKGEIICLLGASGCGKTTLLKAISGLLPLCSGEIYLNQKLIDNGKDRLAPEHRNMGFIFQDYALFPHLNVEQNIAFGLKKDTAVQRKSIVNNMLQLVQLQDLAHRYPHELSGGQQQRVAIARSLAYKPDLLLLDEPFSNIDTQVRSTLMQEIRHLFKQQGVTAIFVTHSREEAFTFSDRVAIMNNGVIEQFGTASELYYEPCNLFVAKFLGNGNYLIAKKTAEQTFHCVLGDISISCSKKIAIGEHCTLLLRPQHIAISASSSGSAVITKQQFIGDHYLYSANIQDEELIIHSQENIAIGQSVTLTANHNHIWIL